MGDVGEMTGIGAPDGSCPPGFRDTHCDRLHNRTVLWIAFGLLFLPALYFFYMAFNDSTVNQGLQDPTSVAAMINGLGVGATAEEVVAFLDRVRAQRMVSGVICFIASLAYLTMALGYGFTVRCFDGRQFFYARYVDWAITTPLMLWEIMEHTAATDAQKYFIYAMDILMIVAGLIGSLVDGSDKWAFFGFSMLCFCPVIWFICSLRENIVDYYKTLTPRLFPSLPSPGSFTPSSGSSPKALTRSAPRPKPSATPSSTSSPSLCSAMSSSTTPSRSTVARQSHL